MGVAELDILQGVLRIYSEFYIYGTAADESLASQIAEDVATHWNEPRAKIKYKRNWYEVRFQIEGHFEPDLKADIVWYNTNPRFNYFRVEEYSKNYVSFVDGSPCNTGYFKLDNLHSHSTTAAHEYGHSLGLDHPKNLDIRGQGVPGIMYPRGTICDPEFQYDPQAAPLQPGGTMNPYYRKVLASDIERLRLPHLSYDHNLQAIVGDFTSVYHEKHLPLV